MKFLNNNKKKIIITAGNSNIGFDLVSYFLKKNYKIFETYRKKKNKLTSKNLSHINFDFKKKFLINENFDLLIHCASLTPYKYKISNEVMRLNVEGFKKILTSKSKFKTIVLLSTVSVYGNIENKILNENIKKKNINAYGYSKLKMEELLIEYCKKNKANYLILRLPGVVGNFCSDVNFINNIIKNFIENKTVKYKNPQSFFNNIVHTETIAKIIEKFMLNNNISYKNKIFNLSSLEPVKLEELINYIKLSFKSGSKIEHLTPSNNFIISTKKCDKYGVELISTLKTVKKNINYILK